MLWLANMMKHNNMTVILILHDCRKLLSGNSTVFLIKAMGKTILWTFDNIHAQMAGTVHPFGNLLTVVY